MKFMEPIETTMGRGLVVGATGEGRVVAAVAVMRLVEEKGKPPVEKRFTPHRIFERCERHAIWFVFPGRCPQCLAEESRDGCGE